MLMSSFAAQVIAQAMNIHETVPASARIAYRGTTKIGRPFLLDDRI